MAMLNSSRDQPCASVIGGRNRPNTERVPNPMTAISAPAAITINGVCQRPKPLDTCAGIEDEAIV